MTILKVTFIFASHYHLGTLALYFSQVPSSVDFRASERVLKNARPFRSSVGDHVVFSKSPFLGVCERRLLKCDRAVEQPSREEVGVPGTKHGVVNVGRVGVRWPSCVQEPGEKACHGFCCRGRPEPGDASWRWVVSTVWGVPSFIKRGLDEVAALRAEAGGQLLF